MRIGLFTDTYPPFINGVSTSVLMLKNGLEKLGHEVYVVTVNPDKMSYRYEKEKKTILLPGIPVGIYDYRLTSIYSLRALHRIKKWHLDIIHSQTEFGVGTFARLISKQFRIPLVHTYHTMYEDCVYHMTDGHFKETNETIVEYITKFYCDKTATELIVPTKKAYQLFKEKYQIDRDIHIVPTGIELERFQEESIDKILTLKLELGIQENDFVILFVGRLGKEKGIEFLLDCEKEIIQKYNFVKLFIIGEGPSMGMIQEQIQKEKLENHVFLLGRVPYEKIPIYYQMADLFVSASKSETQGLTIMEAMSSALPVLVIEDDCFLFLVKDDYNGYFFHNKQEYVEKISKIIQNPDVLKKLGRQAKSSTEMYSALNFSKNVLRVYKIALQKRKSKWIKGWKENSYEK